MRERGFYWVRRECWSGEPEVAHWDGDEWVPCGDDRGAHDDSDTPVEVLSERLTPPPKHEMPVQLRAVHALDSSGKWWDLQIMSVSNGVIRVQLTSPVQLKRPSAKPARKAASKARS